MHPEWHHGCRLHPEDGRVRLHIHNVDRIFDPVKGSLYVATVKSPNVAAIRKGIPTTGRPHHFHPRRFAVPETDRKIGVRHRIDPNMLERTNYKWNQLAARELQADARAGDVEEMLFHPNRPSRGIETASGLLKKLLLFCFGLRYYIVHEAASLIPVAVPLAVRQGHGPIDRHHLQRILRQYRG